LDAHKKQGRFATDSRSTGRRGASLTVFNMTDEDVEPIDPYLSRPRLSKAFNPYRELRPYSQLPFKTVPLLCDHRRIRA